MKRREFVAALASAATVAPVFRAKAQRRRTIAYFAPARTQHLITAFQNGLRDLGYVEGQNTYHRLPLRQRTKSDARGNRVRSGRRAPDVIVVSWRCDRHPGQASDSDDPYCVCAGRRSGP